MWLKWTNTSKFSNLNVLHKGLSYSRTGYLYWGTGFTLTTKFVFLTTFLFSVPWNLYPYFRILVICSRGCLLVST